MGIWPEGRLLEIQSVTVPDKARYCECVRMRGEREKRRAEFLTKAAEADKFAAESKDSRIRDSWKEIADGYRDLAARNA